MLTHSTFAPQFCSTTATFSFLPQHQPRVLQAIPYSPRQQPSCQQLQPISSKTAKWRHKDTSKSPKVALLPHSFAVFRNLHFSNNTMRSSGTSVPTSSARLARWPQPFSLQLKQVHIETEEEKTKKKKKNCSSCSTAWQPEATEGVLQEVSTLHPQTDLSVLTNGQTLISAIFLTASLPIKKKKRQT